VLEKLTVAHRLTFHPELVDACVHLRRLEADAKSGEDQHPHEEHLAGVTMQKAAQLEHVALQARPQPQRGTLPLRFTLKQYGGPG
jgi:hypothetical protein